MPTENFPFPWDLMQQTGTERNNFFFFVESSPRSKGSTKSRVTKIKVDFRALSQLNHGAAIKTDSLDLSPTTTTLLHYKDSHV